MIFFNISAVWGVEIITQYHQDDEIVYLEIDDWLIVD